MAVRKPLKAFAASYDADGFATATPTAFRELEATDTIPVDNIPELPQSKITGLEDALSAANYLVYRALVTQSGTSDPAATVLENTLGGTVVWSRNDVGDYVGNLNGAFLANKIFFTLHHALYSAGVFATRFNDDYVRIIVRDSSGTFVEYNSANPINIAILVYP